VAGVASIPPQPRCARLEVFDELHLDLVAGQVDAVALVLESHMPTLLAWLRPQEDAEALLAGLRRAVEMCESSAIPLEVEVPFLSENAYSLPQTIAAFAAAGVRTLRVVPARQVPGRERPLDPLASLSERYIERVRQLCEEAAETGAAQLVWEPHEGTTFGLRELPGFCEDAWGRLNVRGDGRVTPCFYAAEGELELGTLVTGKGLPEIWQGRESLDLRRAHLTWDYPRACTSCPRSSTPELREQMPFIARFAAEMVGEGEPEPAIEPLSPAPLARMMRAPTIALALPARAVRAWHFAWSQGGTAEALQSFEARPEYDGQAVSLALPTGAWEDMTPNVGYWWAVFAEFEDGGWAVTRGVRCLVSHQPLPRVPGSRLRYPGDPRRDPESPAVLSPTMGDADYDTLVARVADAVRTVVPAGAIAAVVSGGDDRLADLGDIQGWHFPRDETGVFAGFNPPDGDWAVHHLRSLRAAGARYLVLPESASWWYETYPQLTAYMVEHCALALEEPGTCVVVALP
jgi:hypothetical protein